MYTLHLLLVPVSDGGRGRDECLSWFRHPSHSDSLQLQAHLDARGQRSALACCAVELCAALFCYNSLRTVVALAITITL